MCFSRLVTDDVRNIISFKKHYFARGHVLEKFFYFLYSTIFRYFYDFLFIHSLG